MFIFRRLCWLSKSDVFVIQIFICTLAQQAVFLVCMLWIKVKAEELLKLFLFLTYIFAKKRSIFHSRCKFHKDLLSIKCIEVNRLRSREETKFIFPLTANEENRYSSNLYQRSRGAFLAKRGQKRERKRGWRGRGAEYIR